MIVGERVRVMKLERPTDQDRGAFEGQDGMLVRRLNVPWTPDYGALWEVRFPDGEVSVFAESELALVGGDGEPEPVDMGALRESWGDAPRRMSLPFKRFGGGSGSALAVLALLVFCVAGVLLVWAGVSESSLALGAAGVLVVLVGIVSAAFLVS